MTPNHPTELGVTVAAFIISILALAVSVGAELRARMVEKRDSRTNAVDLALDIETMLSILYSQMLTVDLAAYRSEVVNVVTAARSQLPGLIHQVRSIREALEARKDTRGRTEVNISLRSLRAGMFPGRFDLLMRPNQPNPKRQCSVH